MPLLESEPSIWGAGNAPKLSFFTKRTIRTVVLIRSTHANNPCLFILIFIVVQNSFGQLMQKDERLLDTKETKLFKMEENGFKSNRNNFLRWATMGQELALLGKFDKSNEYLECAYETLENKEYKVVREERFGFEYEMYMALYLKALNYCNMSRPDEALVECNRMKEWLCKDSSARHHQLQFKDEPLPHLLLGIIYETEGFYNDAYIAYQTAYRLYKESYIGFFSASDVFELQNAVLTTAYAAELMDEFARLKEEFDLDNFLPEKIDAGEMIFICHMGVGPYENDASDLAEYQASPTYLSAKLKNVATGVTYRFGTAFQINYWKHKNWWTSLPRGIYFARVPLQPGPNKFELTWYDQAGLQRIESIEIGGNGGNQVRVFSSFEPQ